MDANQRILVPNLPTGPPHAPAGWVDLIEQIIAVLDRAHPDWRLIQVTQESGGLRVSYSPASLRHSPAGKAIREIEVRSLSTCDVCGAAATTEATAPASRPRCQTHRSTDGVDVPIQLRPVAALDETMGGVWLVTTKGSTHIWDLDYMTYTRHPGPSSRVGGMLFDGNAMPITHVEVWPTIGERFIVWFDDPEDPDLFEHFRISTRVLSIEAQHP